MKVVHLSYAASNKHGSEAGNGWRTAVSIADRGHRVTLITSDRYEFDAQAAPAGLEVEVVPRRSTVGLPRRVALYAEYLNWLSDAVEHASSASPDIVHHVTWGGVSLGSPVGTLPYPSVWGPLGGGQVASARLWPEFRRSAPFESVRSTAVHLAPVINRLARAAATTVDVALATNDPTRALLERLGARDVRMLPDTAIDLALIRDDSHRPSRVRGRILWVGRFFAIKAPRLAVRAFKRLSDVCPDAEMLMVGDGPELGATRAEVRSLGLSERVSFVGMIPWLEVFEQLDRAELFLMSSLRDSNPAQILEAAARGVPIVTVDGHGGADAVRKHGAGMVVPKKSLRDIEAGLAESMRLVISNEPARMAFTEGALRMAKANTWAERGHQLGELYDDVVEKWAH